MLEVQNFIVCERIEDGPIPMSHNMYNVSQMFQLADYPGTIRLYVLLTCAYSGILHPWTMHIDLVGPDKQKHYKWSQEVRSLPSHSEEESLLWMAFDIPPMTIPAPGRYHLNLKFNTVLKRSALISFVLPTAFPRRAEAVH
jgi:hypothetical protein